MTNVLFRRAAAIALIATCGVAGSCYRTREGELSLVPPRYRRFVSTDGKVWITPRRAAVASAAHDIPCEGAVTIDEDAGDDPAVFVVEGCGVRLTFHVSCGPDQSLPSGDVISDYSFLLVGRVDLTPARPAVPPPTSSSGGSPQ